MAAAFRPRQFRSLLPESRETGGERRELVRATSQRPDRSTVGPPRARRARDRRHGRRRDRARDDPEHARGVTGDRAGRRCWHEYRPPRPVQRDRPWWDHLRPQGAGPSLGPRGRHSAQPMGCMRSRSSRDRAGTRGCRWQAEAGAASPRRDPAPPPTGAARYRRSPRSSDTAARGGRRRFRMTGAPQRGVPQSVAHSGPLGADTRLPQRVLVTTVSVITSGYVGWSECPPRRRSQADSIAAHGGSLLDRVEACGHALGRCDVVDRSARRSRGD